MTQYKIYTTGGVLDKVMHTKLVAYTDSMPNLREFIASYTLSANYAALRKEQRMENNDPRITLVPNDEFIIAYVIDNESFRVQFDPLFRESEESKQAITKIIDEYYNELDTQFGEVDYKWVETHELPDAISYSELEFKLSSENINKIFALCMRNSCTESSSTMNLDHRFSASISYYWETLTDMYMRLYDLAEKQKYTKEDLSEDYPEFPYIDSSTIQKIRELIESNQFNTQRFYQYWRLRKEKLINFVAKKKYIEYPEMTVILLTNFFKDVYIDLQKSIK